MAIKKSGNGSPESRKKVTSIGGHVRRSIPKNKKKRDSFKPYRGQGR